MANVKPNMIGDPYARKHAAVSRLRQQLRKKRESLADHFEFKMYITFHFKDKVNLGNLYKFKQGWTKNTGSDFD